MGTPFTTLASLLPCLASAQTYYYINSISVDPSLPTTNDAITITLHGDLSSGGAYIVSSSAQVVGDTVMIDVTAADAGGIAVLVPHDEVLSIGTLAAGDHTIQVNTSFAWDMAPQPQHLFTVSGSTGVGTRDVPGGVRTVQAGGELLITSLDGSAVGDAILVDVQGRIAAVAKSAGRDTRLRISSITSGAYILQLPDRSISQRMMLAGR